jgi:hypothetical protein
VTFPTRKDFSQKINGIWKVKIGLRLLPKIKAMARA